MMHGLAKFKMLMTTLIDGWLKGREWPCVGSKDTVNHIM